VNLVHDEIALGEIEGARRFPAPRRDPAPVRA
jgi:hypothetical protein